MKRRNFIKLSATASAIALLPSEVAAMLKQVGTLACPNFSNRKLVLIQLAGGNDGINTLVPMNQYDTYAQFRPTLRLPLGGTHGLIQLDGSLAPEKQLGLHPALTGFKNLYENGLLQIIQGVGYPNTNKSHFKSTDLWLSGGDGTTPNFDIQSGWTGRFLENQFPDQLQANYPLGIQLGSGDASLGFDGEHEHHLAININTQDANGYYSELNGQSGTAPNPIPNSEYGDKLRYILEVDSAANHYQTAVTTAFTKGKNVVQYPDTDLANQLKTVAKFISGDLETKIYLVRLKGFDNHENQVRPEGSHLGIHANLLQELSSAVNAFMLDLHKQQRSDEVLALTFSEFGRKIAENSNYGTDHGEVAPLFVFGKAIQPGVKGTNPNLSEATEENNFQVQTIQHDYRDVFGTLLQDWMGSSTAVLDRTLYDANLQRGFAQTKIEQVLQAPYAVPDFCRGDATPPKNVAEPRFYPNPCDNVVHLDLGPDLHLYKLALYSDRGRLVVERWNTTSDFNFSFSVADLAAGLYIAKTTTNHGVFTSKIYVVRN